jgi:hypothetical protein
MDPVYEGKNTKRVLRVARAGMAELLFPTPLLAHSDMGSMTALSVHQ